MCLLDIVAMLSVSSTKPQRFQPEQADGGIAPHFSGQQGNRLEKPETRPDPFFRARLIRVRNGSTVTEFVYDGLGRRVAEWDNGSLAKQWVWCGTELCEERNASNTVTKRFFPQGEQISGTAYFYSRDHLGSVREMTDASGTVHARYNYDPFGARSANTITTSAVESDFGFTGDYYNATVGLDLTLYRAYNPVLGRWINRDPIGEKGGMKLFGYAGNNPINLTDPLGTVAGVDDAAEVGAWSAGEVAGAVTAGALAIDAMRQESQTGQALKELLNRLAAIKTAAPTGTCQKDPCQGLLNQMLEHMQKLDDYTSNPDGFDNLGYLKNAATPQIRQSIIDGRINNLKNQIQNFKDQYNACRAVHGLPGI